MEYFFTPPHLVTPPSLSITGEEFRHLHKVIRRKVGDTVFVVDGEGNLYETMIEKVDRKQAICSIVQRSKPSTEPHIEVTLAAALLKNPSRFDFMVEKAVELGVKSILPIKTERTIPSRARQDRWAQLAIAAMKQSGRVFLPPVKPVTTLEHALRQGADLRLIAHEKASPDDTLPRVLQRRTAARSVLLLIGPEGGFSNEEFEFAVRNGCSPLFLGPRRLRAETAALMSVTLCVSYCGIP